MNLRVDTPRPAIILAIILLLLLPAGEYFSQGVAVNDSGGTSDPSAMLDVASSDKGVLIPRLSAAEISAISNPASSLIVYQTDGLAGYYFNSGTQTTPHWVFLTTSEQIQANALNYLPVDGLECSYQVTSAIVMDLYTEGMMISFKSGSACNGPATLQYNDLDAVSIKKRVSEDLGPGDILPGQIVTVIYDGTNFQLVSATSSSSSSSACSEPPAAAGSIGGNPTVCTNNIGTYFIEPVTGATSYSWAYTPSTGVTISGSSNQVSLAFSALASSGTLTVTATNSCGSGSTSAAFAITVNTTPTPGFSTNPVSPFITTESIVFTPNTSGVNYYWSFPGGAPASSAAENPSVIWNSSGTFSVGLTATSPTGCSVTTYSPVTAECHGSQTFSSTGSHTFVADACMSNICVEVWGGGGGGGGMGDYNYYAPGGGGGGGGYGQQCFSVTPGNYTVVVGAAGAASGAAANPGGNGGTSSLSGPGVSISATGGVGGGVAPGSSSPGAGGAGGTSSASTNLAGTNGSNGLYTGNSSSNKGGNGGAGANGGAGGFGQQGDTPTVGAGSAPGGGGGGAATWFGAGNTGGAGAAGQVKITW